ncbi:MAG: hypothetical protein GF411_09650 [Candidatus Lokiarchaeota archaeon]|nr:hypothetical protein [Candidatus Lokiarchaeota archaeon]
MDFQHLKDTANFLFASMMDAMVDLGVSPDLMFAGMARSFEGECRELLARDGLDLTKLEDAANMEELVQHWADALEKNKLAAHVEIHRVDDEEIDVEMGGCVFSEACKINKQHHEGDIPLCPWIGVLYALVEEKYGKHLHLNTADHHVEKDHHFFNLHVTDW